MPRPCRSPRELMFSQRLLDLHPDEEISAICAHEMGHLTESRSVIAGRLVGSLRMFPLLFLKPAIHAANCLFLLLIGLAVFGLGWFARRLARKMEVRADQVATANQSGDGIYARALERLHEANQIPAVMRSKRMTHPHLYDRMLAVGITPDYPRPEPPGRLAWNYLLGLIIFTLVVTVSIALLLAGNM